MSNYCPIDEAFGSFMTNGFNIDPLEGANYRNDQAAKCKNRKKIKKKRVNCNKDSSRFTENLDDLFINSPELTDSDQEFAENTNNFYPLDNIDLYNIDNKSPTKNKKSKLTRKRSKVIEGFQSNNNNNYNSSNYNNNNNNNNNNNYNKRDDVLVKRKKKSRKNNQVNEVFEYSPEDNVAIDDLKYIHGINNEIDEDDDSESDAEETPPTFKVNNTPSLTTSGNRNNSNTNGVNSQISEINNKINFIMNQISNKENDIKESVHNNIHDIILFVIFGIFILIILESLYRLISKMIRANTILKYTPDYGNVANNAMNNAMNNVANAANNIGETKPSGGNNTFDMVTEYIKNKK